MNSWPKSWATPRTHQSDGGLLVNIAAAAERLGLKPATFSQRVLEKRLWSNGKPLAPIPQRISFGKTDGTKGKETAFLASEVEHAYTIPRPSSWNKSPPRPPPDAISSKEAARLAHVSRDAVREWCGWGTHPLLGRKLNHGRARRDGPIKVSRADILAISGILDNPSAHSIPGNTGIWIAEGIYRDSEGELWFTNSYLFKRYRIHKSQLCSLQKNGQLRHQDVIWPTRMMTRISGKLPGAVIVNHDQDVQEILRRRGAFVPGAKPPKTGDWLHKYTVWRDADGLWFSSAWLAERTGFHVAHTSKWRREGLLTRTRKVPKDFVGRKGGGGGPILLHHDDEVSALLRKPTESSINGTGGAIHEKVSVKGTRRNLRGPEKADQTIQIEDHCYDALKAGKKKRNTIAREVREKFNQAKFAITSVTIYARRRAKRPDDPQPWPVKR